ncbi:PACE efflux transporter [Mycolicibacter kumamotonensis]|uniref:Membrane protein n=1 Tax=Mycolicibacter kumamotonensis TaxID=354243 RepID=A0A1B8SF06_9MYCO|nr:PACE efflux transporter [Mycolicibacter kumamotonensis]NDJ88435.1 PACE efflux transporter [Mycolicibacter kumamotonensis]OBY31266.1 membrane protein [Mycolicibacter kumamotonensis]
MSPVVRRIIYVISYELIAIALTAIGLVALGFGGGSSGGMAVTASTVAVVWNYIWNTVFEAWERRQASPTRTPRRRVVHAIGFEGGLVVVLLPVVAWILHVSLLQAFGLEVGLLAFFLVYTFVFTWLFDKVLPPRTSPGAR